MTKYWDKTNGEWKLRRIKNLNRMKELTSLCPSCDRKEEHKYVGYQEGIKGKEGFHLYECSHCESSHSLGELL